MNVNAQQEPGNVYSLVGCCCFCCCFCCPKVEILVSGQTIIYILRVSHTSQVVGFSTAEEVEQEVVPLMMILNSVVVPIVVVVVVVGCFHLVILMIEVDRYYYCFFLLVMLGTTW